MARCVTGGANKASVISKPHGPYALILPGNMYVFFFSYYNSFFSFPLLVIDPAIKLDWYWQDLPDCVEWVKQLFIDNVSAKLNTRSLADYTT